LIIPAKNDTIREPLHKDEEAPAWIWIAAQG
jgi:hypothetical protein